MTGSRLTRRQREVVILLAEGSTYKQVARALGVTERTIRMHVKDIAARLDGDGSPLRRVLRHSARLLVA